MIPTVYATERAVLSKEEQSMLVNELFYKRPPCWQIFMLILATGLRIREVFPLTWGDIDFQRLTLNVNKSQVNYRDPDDPNACDQLGVGSPKTKSSKRIIPLLPKIAEILEEIQEEQTLKHGIKPAADDLIFKSSQTGAMRTYAPVQQRFVKLRNQLNLNPELTIHCLRHTFATRGLENGVSLPVMKELLGHSNVEMTGNTYTHVLNETKHEFILNMQDAIVFDGAQVMDSMADLQLKSIKS